MIRELLDRIKKADSKELEEIREQWAIDGEYVSDADWTRYWYEFNRRELELKGIDPDSRPF